MQHLQRDADLLRQVVCRVDLAEAAVAEQSLEGVPSRLVERQRAVRSDVLVEGEPVEALHQDPRDRRRVGEVEVLHLDHMLAANAPRGRGLVGEAGAHRGLRAVRGEQHLEGEGLATKLHLVDDLVHLAMPPSPSGTPTRNLSTNSSFSASAIDSPARRYPDAATGRHTIGALHRPRHAPQQSPWHPRRHGKGTGPSNAFPLAHAAALSGTFRGAHVSPLSPIVMARNDLLLNLVKSGAQGDQLGFRRTLEAMIADERQRQHHTVADRLAEFLKTPRPTTRATTGDATGSLVERHPEQELDALLLPQHVQSTVRELVEEQHRADLLRSHGIEPRHRVLLVGAPGTGKTSLAEAIATELAVPLLTVRYEAVVTSYLGETAVRLARMFEEVRDRPCVLFFDEFDAIGKERGDEHETGEIKRVVSALLLQLDALPSYVVTVAATNHPELLDRAAWRRFQVRMTLPMPDEASIAAWLARFEAQAGVRLGSMRAQVVARLAGLSWAEVVEFGTDLRRRIVLEGADVDVRRVVTSRLAQWEERATTQRGDATGR